MLRAERHADLASLAKLLVNFNIPLHPNPWLWKYFWLYWAVITLIKGEHRNVDDAVWSTLTRPSNMEFVSSLGWYHFPQHISRRIQFVECCSAARLWWWVLPIVSTMEAWILNETSLSEMWVSQRPRESYWKDSPRKASFTSPKSSRYRPPKWALGDSSRTPVWEERVNSSSTTNACFNLTYRWNVWRNYWGYQWWLKITIAGISALLRLTVQRRK